MKQQWEKISSKLEAMSQRERGLVFIALVFLILSAVNFLLLDPLLVQQKSVRMQVAQQQQAISQVQVQISALIQENSPDAHSPLHDQLRQIKLELAEGNAFLQSNRERLVNPEKMAAHLRQLLNRNSRLQLVVLKTLPASPLIELPVNKNPDAHNESLPVVTTESSTTKLMDKKVYKHGVELTLRGNYLDLLQYLGALEELPQQMYWAKAQLSVAKYPSSELSLTLYTLSLDKKWLQI